MFTAELDISYETPQAEVLAFAAARRCGAILIEEFGLGGGNPVYQFVSNSYQELYNLALEILEDEEYAASVICDESLRS